MQIRKFIDSGFFLLFVRFGIGDVIGCYLDLSGYSVKILFTLNGFNLGVAFDVPKAELNGRALFPHIFTKNQHFTVNFGQLPQPMRPILPGK
jgi:heterogeneous nuclear ribonucleoprotein U-like protein 1